jgi:hypothetical protein
MGQIAAGSGAAGATVGLTYSKANFIGNDSINWQRFNWQMAMIQWGKWQALLRPSHQSQTTPHALLWPGCWFRVRVRYQQFGIPHAVCISHADHMPNRLPKAVQSADMSRLRRYQISVHRRCRCRCRCLPAGETKYKINKTIEKKRKEGPRGRLGSTNTKCLVAWRCTNKNVVFWNSTDQKTPGVRRSFLAGAWCVCSL